MKSFPESDKILWAVDPFAEREMLQRSAAWAIHEITKNRATASVQPVYLVNDWIEDAVPQRLIRSFLRKTQIFGSDSLKRILHRIPLQAVQPLEVLSYSFRSLEDGARGLLSYARRKHFGLIVASTRSNTKSPGSPLSFMGSFVETLTEHSDLPLMVVNPRWRPTLKIPSLLFPTDLSPESYDSFIEMLEFVRPGSRKITLFYKLDFPLSQPVDVASRIFPEIRTVLSKKTQIAQAEAKRWANVAEKKGIHVSLLLDTRPERSMPTALLDWMSKHTGSVVLAPPVSAIFPRRTIRLLMNQSRFPVLFFPTELKAAGKGFGAREAA